jgi:hypothetical protein
MAECKKRKLDAGTGCHPCCNNPEREGKDCIHGISSGTPKSVSIPTLQPDPNTGLIAAKTFFDAFNSYQAVYITNALGLQHAEPEGHTSRENDVADDTEGAGAGGDSNTPKPKCMLTWHDLHALFTSLNDKDKESWCIENEGNNNNDDDGSKKKKTKQDASFLHAQDDKNNAERGYCSFIVQNEIKAMQSTLNRTPIRDLPVAKEPHTITEGNEESQHATAREEKGTESSEGERNQQELTAMSYGPCLWFFFGRNNKPQLQTPLQGRPEHTDSLAHDATWHYQLSGVKQWVIRPTLELLQRDGMPDWPLQQMENDASCKTNPLAKDDSSNNEKVIDQQQEAAQNDAEKCNSNGGVPVTIECQQGDILIINTRLWWHQTLIPHQTDPSVSYARDVYFAESKGNSASGSVENANSGDGAAYDTPPTDADPVVMTNLDGLYAADAIDTSTIVFREDSMPDCELHRSLDPNCAVVELEDGTGAVVSLRPIAAGEFFCVAESDDEEDGEFEEEEEVDAEDSEVEDE